MSRFMVRSSLAAVAIWALLAMAARAADKKISFDKAPREVRDAVMNRFPGADVTSIEAEKEGGKVVYDIELKHKGRKYEMDIQADGTIIEIEKEVTARDVVETVTKAVKEKYADARVETIMEVNKVTGKQEKPIHYEVDIVLDGKKKEVLVALDGKSVKEEKKEEK